MVWYTMRKFVSKANTNNSKNNNNRNRHKYAKISRILNESQTEGTASASKQLCACCEGCSSSSLEYTVCVKGFKGIYIGETFREAREY